MATPNVEVFIRSDGTFGDTSTFDDASTPRRFLLRNDTSSDDIELWVSMVDVEDKYVLVDNKAFSVGVNGVTVYTNIPFIFVKGKKTRSSESIITCFVGAEELTTYETIVIATNAHAQPVVNDATVEARTTWTEVLDTTLSFDKNIGVFNCRRSGFFDFDYSSQYAATAASLGAEFYLELILNGTLARQVVFVNPVASLAQLRDLRLSSTLRLQEGDVVVIGVRIAGAGGDISTTATPSANYLTIASVR